MKLSNIKLNSHIIRDSLVKLPTGHIPCKSHGTNKNSLNNVVISRCQFYAWCSCHDFPRAYLHSPGKKLWIGRLSWTKPFWQPIGVNLFCSWQWATVHDLSRNAEHRNHAGSRFLVLFTFGPQSAIEKKAVYHAGWENRISIWNSPFKPTLVRNVRFHLLAPEWLD